MDVFLVLKVCACSSKDYLHCLCSLIHGLYFMHLVTRFKGIDSNTDTSMVGDCVLQLALLIVL